MIAPTVAPEVMHAIDLTVRCRRCGAAVGVECRDLAAGVVHFGRRLAALLSVAQDIPGALRVAAREVALRTAGTADTPPRPRARDASAPVPRTRK
jgi:hypothetical protein